MADPYELDDEGNPVAAEVDAEAAPIVDDPVRRQVERTLRLMLVSTAIGVAFIVIIAAIFADIRGLMILVAIVYLVTSLTAYWYLRRTLTARLKRPRPGAG